MGQHLICRVKVLGQATQQKVEFVWSLGSSCFEPIVLSPDQVIIFRKNAKKARSKLSELVSLHMPPPDARDASAIRRECFDLATLGRYLYNQLLPVNDPTGNEVRQWL